MDYINRTSLSYDNKEKKLILSLGLSIMIIRIKKSLEILITLENSIEILRTPC